MGQAARPPIALRADDVIAEDPEQLREAVESGRSALRTVDDARAAIIACYLAMETTLAERGTARGAAGRPASCWPGRLKPAWSAAPPPGS